MFQLESKQFLRIKQNFFVQSQVALNHLIKGIQNNLILLNFMKKTCSSLNFSFPFARTICIIEIKVNTNLYTFLFKHGKQVQNPSLLGIGQHNK